MKGRILKLKLKTKTEEQTNVISVKIDDLQEFIDHPFKVLDNEDMQKLTDSIKENGVITPILVAKGKAEDNKYVIVSGHRRVNACRKLGIKSIPAICKEMNRMEATIAMVDANLAREHILPSEKAKSYKMKMDAMKHQGKAASDQIGPKLTADEISDTDSASQVKRYIRLNNLCPQLLNLVDEGKIGLSPAVELSYLKYSEQNYLLCFLNDKDKSISLSQAARLKKLSQDGKFIKPELEKVFSDKQRADSGIYKLSAKRLKQLAPNVKTNDELLDYLSKACEYYEKYLMM